MVERDVRAAIIEEEARVEDFILSHKICHAEQNDVGRLVASTISLRAQYGLEINPQTEQIIVMFLTSSLYLSSKYLDLPIPNGVGFVQGEKGVPNRTVNKGLYVGAESSTPKKYPEGLINFSAYNIKTNVADVLEGNTYGADPIEALKLLAKISSHEMRHIRQRKDSPVELDRDIEVLGKQGLKAWTKTQSEQEAVMFENIFANAYIAALIENPLI